MSARRTLLYATAAACVALDQVTKALARELLSPGRPVTIIPGLFDLDISYNRGAAFGLLPDWAPLFIVIALVVIFAVVKLKDTGAGSRALAIGCGLVVGGAAGNLIDRLLSRGRAVTDFVSVHILIGGEVHAWPTFNLADAAIVVGVILVLFHVYIVEKRVLNRS